MSEALTRKRCFHHAQREAAARCPECGHFYCRECVTEHEGRVLCVRCLSHLNQEAPKARLPLGGFVLAAQAVSALLLLWFIFYSVGEGLASLPDAFHDDVSAASSFESGE